MKLDVFGPNTRKERVARVWFNGVEQLGHVIRCDDETGVITRYKVQLVRTPKGLVEQRVKESGGSVRERLVGQVVVHIPATECTEFYITPGFRMHQGRMYQDFGPQQTTEEN